MSLTLWLIRHGQTSVNAGTWSSTPGEACLTDLGEKQAMTAALEVKNQPDLIIVSPLVRARDSALFLSKKWPECPVTIWPIQEFIYLSPAELKKVDQADRKRLVDSYWEKSDPFYCHHSDTESFSAFLKRIESFHHQISKLNGYIVVVGHGQFFKAYQLGLKYGFNSSETWMRRYRREEVNHPIKNGEVVKIFFA